MQKIAIWVFFLLLSQRILAKQSLPILKASSTKVDIRVGDDFFAKAGWILEPAKKPDVFSIGSKEWYETKKVTFITDIDSISFNVQPGHTYDFIILLNGKTPCYTQIVAQAHPVFFDSTILLAIVCGYILILFSWYINRHKIKAEKLVQLGYLVSLLFWLMTFISGYLHGNYTHLSHTISELGAIGTRSELFTSCSLMLLAILSTLFSIGFYQSSQAKQLSVLPAILSFSKPITLSWASVFTLGNAFHPLTGFLPGLILLASLLAYLLWRKRVGFATVSILSLFSFFVMMLIGLRFIHPLNDAWEGLIQRFFYLGWTIWTIAISYHLSKNKEIIA